MVLVSKENKKKIYEYILKEGVIVVKKDSYLPKHQQLKDVPNLQVMMIVKSLKSKGFLQDVFCWQWAYYTVTNKGVQYLVKELGKCPPHLQLSPPRSFPTPSREERPPRAPRAPMRARRRPLLTRADPPA